MKHCKYCGIELKEKENDSRLYFCSDECLNQYLDD